MLLIAVTLLISMLYLFVGIDFEIFEYQFSSRLRKFILIILVGAAIATSVVIFQSITNNRLLTPSIMGLDAVYLFIKNTSLLIWYTVSLGYKCIFKFHTNTCNDGIIRVITFHYKWNIGITGLDEESCVVCFRAGCTERALLGGELRREHGPRAGGHEDCYDLWIRCAGTCRG